VRLVAGEQAAAKVLGYRFESPVDPAGDPKKVKAAIEQAVNAKADAIILNAIDPEAVSGAVAAARKAGIIVVCVSCGLPAKGTGPTGVTFDTSVDFGRQGELLAAFVGVDSNGAAKIAMMNDPEFLAVRQRYEGFRNTIKQCTGCSVVASQQFSQTEIGPPLSAKGQTLLKANSSAKYLWIGFDAAAAPVVEGMQQQGASKAKVMGFDGNKQNIALVDQGLEYASIATPLDWLGWAGMDNLNRTFQKEKLLEDEGLNLPSLLITKENAAPYLKAGYQGGIDYSAKYTQLWTTGKTDDTAAKG
jgi:ribose transport system substrate-binding protein